MQVAEGTGGDLIALCLREDRLGGVFLTDREVMPYNGDADYGAGRKDTPEEAEAAGWALPLASGLTAFTTTSKPESEDWPSTLSWDRGGPRKPLSADRASG